MPVRVPFSKSTVFKLCRQKMCRFRVNGRPIRHIFHRFQNVPASCERSLSGEGIVSKGKKGLRHLNLEKGAHIFGSFDNSDFSQNLC